MDFVSNYISGVFSRAIWQLWHVFGVVFIVAYLLQRLGYKIRLTGVGHFGGLYWYLVSIGVACHEIGHAAGCILTRTRIIEIVPFTTDDKERLGYVRHGRASKLAQVVISTGPIWFGCIMISFITWLLVGDISIARWRDHFHATALPGALEYGWALLRAMLDGCGTILASTDVFTLGFWCWIYLAFCIASEIGLSSVDIKHMRPGLMRLVLLFFAVNIVPIVGETVSKGIFIIMPYLFRIHVLMITSLVVNFALYLILACHCRGRRIFC